MHLTREQEFLYVKEKLDYYEMPTLFPQEATKLISKLLQKLDNNTNKHNQILIR